MLKLINILLLLLLPVAGCGLSFYTLSYLHGSTLLRAIVHVTSTKEIRTPQWRDKRTKRESGNQIKEKHLIQYYDRQKL